MGRGARAGVAAVAVAVSLAVAPYTAAASARPTQADSTVTTVAAPAAGTTVATTATTSGAVDPAETDGSSATVVGDPAADRRIRRIVIGLCAVAVAVLIVTMLFWRATRPVPRALRGLRALGSRAGRRRAAEAAGTEPPPPSVAPALVPATGAASLPDDG